MRTNRQHAVILGGSIAGLFAAGVLADAYEHVTVVERDFLPYQSSHRRGVSQSHHVHGLLPRAGLVAESLMPGLTQRLIAAGALPGDILGNVRWYLNGRPLAQTDTGLLALSASRPLLENAIRDGVRAKPNVSFMDGYDVVSVQASADRSRITGVRVTSPHAGISHILPADLVVDATGRGTRAQRWLDELGYDRAPEDVVDIDLAYASCRFTPAVDVFGHDSVIVGSRYPGQPRSCVMQLLEDGSALVTLTGIHGERPPGDLPGFIEYASGMPSLEGYELARVSAPIGDPVTIRFPRYVRRRYESLDRFPAGLLVTGDALCNLNPVYAQGMTVAALHAEALRDFVSDGDPDPHRYFAAAAQAIDPAWLLSVGGDIAAAGIAPPATMPPSPMPPEYMRQLQLAAYTDAEVAAAFIRVTALVDPLPGLLRPEIAARVEHAHATLAA